MYIGGRALQGLSAAIVYVVGLAIVVDTVEPGRVGEYMGYVSLAMSIGTLLGPVLGGVVYDTGGYYAVFGLAFGVLGWDIIIRLAMIQRQVAVKWNSNEATSETRWVNQNIGGETALSSQLSKDRHESAACAANPHIPSNTPRMREKKRFSNIPAFLLLKSPRLIATLWCCFVVSLVETSFEAVSHPVYEGLPLFFIFSGKCLEPDLQQTLPLLVMDTFGWSSLGSGLIFLPLVVPNFLAPFAGEQTRSCSGTR